MGTGGRGSWPSVAVFAGFVSLILLLAAGCAGDGGSQRTASVDTSASTDASGAGISVTTAPTSTPASTQASGAASTVGGSSPTTRAGVATSRSGGGTTRSQTTRKTSPTTRRTTPTTKPQVKPKLTVSVVETGNADGRVQVNGGSTCASTCTFSFAKGASITLDPIPIEAHTDWQSSSGQVACDAGNPCTFTIDGDLSITAVFGDQPEEDG